ncbi:MULTISPECIES: hypothetical protein [Caproicibacterium]|jgi:hypothetical protein|uniref:DUF2190 family protein n=1 Tax=Caproicibacterium lactatifermentans TaxID=2666138 RepID=A0A859DMQ5_9FIRM|nr:hypothetical protein [Caproicibacterium lactatifermentans]ARP49531.1 hypothetical protein B6259_00640 [Ruminococcaceae bacterium CPB6]MDD4808100.1 hypothetical protein [Oscillospiraceae bacterium]QKN23118.1 hypothetical protein GJQ69_00620 [Caproicibacterium lactatifermentans]QKO30276.1 hypothetical protein GKP14_04150 [Caproicibacterium lactatifermentans]
METSMNGYGENAATFLCKTQLTPGTPVMVTANGTVSAASGNFCGVVLSWRDGVAAVQMEGYVQLPYSGAKPALGYQTLTAANGKVAVSTADGGVQRLVVDTDSTTIGLLL